MTYDAVITNSHVVTDQGLVDKNIIIDDGKIIGLTTDAPSCDKKINGQGLVSIPGVIDTHVHNMRICYYRIICHLDLCNDFYLLCV